MTLFTSLQSECNKWDEIVLELDAIVEVDVEGVNKGISCSSSSSSWLKGECMGWLIGWLFLEYSSLPLSSSSSAAITRLFVLFVLAFKTSSALAIELYNNNLSLKWYLWWLLLSSLSSFLHPKVYALLAIWRGDKLVVENIVQGAALFDPNGFDIIKTFKQMKEREIKWFLLFSLKKKKE